MRSVFWCVPVLIAALLVTGCKKDEAAEAPEPTEAPTEEPSAEIDPSRLEMFAPLPEAFTSEDNPITPEKVALGRMLYFENRLSKAQDISCNTCHVLDEYGIDPRDSATSEGHLGQLGDRNSPTVYNAAGQFVQFWDGRAAHVEEQALGPLVNPVEMGMPDTDYAVKVLGSIPGYGELFREAFPDAEEPITADHIGQAIGAFERKLVTPSRWDAFLEGDEDALTDAEKKGFNVFVDTGCVSCHTGSLVGGQQYQTLGLVKPWPDKEDQGRFEVTRKDEDKMKFKVPLLRNIEKTGPYFHSGDVEELDEAVKRMARHQLGRELSDEDTRHIVTWLKTLTGELPPEELIAKPELPESGPETPKPDPGAESEAGGDDEGAEGDEE